MNQSKSTIIMPHTTPQEIRVAHMHFHYTPHNLLDGLKYLVFLDKTQ